MKGLQLPLGVQLADSASFDNFHAGPNAEALAAVRGMNDAAAPQLLLLYGAPGSGKSHLLQALSRHASGSRACAYVPLRQLAADALEGLDEADIVCVDDVDAALGGAAPLALLRFLDRLRAQGGRGVLAAAAPPERLTAALPDLKTRLSGAAVYGLRPLADADRIALIRARARAQGLEFADEAARWLLTQLPRDTGSLLAAVQALDRASLSAQRRLTLPFVQQWFREEKRA